MPDNYFEEEDFQAGFKGRVLLRIGSLVRPYSVRLIGFITAILLVALLDAVFTYLSKRVIDEGIGRQDPTAVLTLLTIYGGLIIIQAIGSFFFIYLTSIMGEQLRYDLRRLMFAHLQKLSLSYFSKTRVGWIMARVTSDSERVSDLMTWFVVDLSWAVMSILSSLIFMLIINWKLTLIVLLILPALVIAAYQFRKRILGEFRKVRKINSRIVGSYNENITGVRVIKSIGREQGNLSDFMELTHSMYNSAYRAAWLSALFLPVVQMISALALSGVV
jgi:ATP-binding cassette, subfamily B, bacterial